MDATLLATKLYIPSLSRRLVPRPRLLAHLADGLLRPLTLISAPAGFGKTTLLAEWRASEAGRDLPLAWVSLDEDDNDLVRFVSYVIAALRTLEQGLGDKTLAIIQSAPHPSPKAVMSALVQDLVSAPQGILRADFVLVLDDYHAISAPPIHEAIGYLLEHLPASMHLMILSRVDPPLPLPRLRVRNQMVELRAEQLRFTPDEALAFLNQVMGLNLSADDVSALERRTEGWIAGLQMAALSLQGHADAASFVKAFTGSHRYIMDYLIAEVLDRQADALREFLLQTCILDRLTGDLCDAVTGSHDGHATLEELEHSNLFIVRLDEERRWYRYHQLFAELLRARLERLQPERIFELHRRASAWYEANQQYPEALDHAIAGKHYDRAAHLVEQVGNSLMASGGWGQVLVYLRALPPALVRSNPRLALLYASALVLVGQPQEVESYLRDVELAVSERAGNDPAQTVEWQGQVAAIRSRVAYLGGNFAHAIEHSRQGLALVPQQDLISRGILTLTLGSSLVLDGQLDEARKVFEDAHRINLAAGNRMFALDSAGSLAQVQEAQGHLHQAAETYRDILRLSGDQTDPNVVSAHLNLGNVLYEWHRLGDAHDHWQRALTLAEQIYMPDGVMLALLWLAKVRWAQGDSTTAEVFIRRADAEIRDLPTSIVKPFALAIMARLALARGDVESVGRWASDLHLSSDADLPKTLFLSRIDYMTRVHLLIAEGKLDEADQLLTKLQRAVVSTGLTGSEVEIWALQALLHRRRGDRSGAVNALTQALKRGEPEGYIQTFLDLGAPMAELLSAVVLRGQEPSYVRELLILMGEPGTGTGQPPPALVEALSERELEVLRLVAQGRSNQQIARDLVVATGTVKKHINNIFAKLDVESRTQAVARARELKLL